MKPATRLILSLFFILFVIETQALTFKEIQFKPEKVAELKNRRSGLVSQSVYKKLSRAYTAITKDNHDRALKLLNKLETQTQSRPFELAQVYQTLGFFYANKNKFETSIDYFNKALALKALPLSPTLSSMYTVAQLHMAQEAYKEGLKKLINWFHHVESPNGSAYVLAATALFELKKKKSALAFINKALQKRSDPPENWLQFAVALNYENKNYRKAASALKILTGRYPHKKKYWKQLVGVYFNLDQMRQALATIQMSHKMGHLIKGKELLNMVSLQISEGLPYKGAQTLTALIKDGKVKKNKKHLEVLAQAWIHAEELEKAITPMAEAARLSKDGITAARYGHLLLELEKFELAVKAYSMSLKKGKLKSPGRIYLSRGIAQFNLKNYDLSLSDFKKSMEREQTKKAAQEWMSYVDLEKKYTKSL